jgi:hypothetical protein
MFLRSRAWQARKADHLSDICEMIIYKYVTLDIIKHYMPSRPVTGITLPIKMKKKKNWLRVPDGSLTLRHTGRLTVGRNITLTLTLTRRGEIGVQPSAWGYNWTTLFQVNINTGTWPSRFMWEPRIRVSKT